MAKKTSKKEGTRKSGTKVVGPPEGYKKVASAQADGFFQFREGAVIHGMLRGKFQGQKDRFGNDRVYYQLELLESCSAQTRDEEGDWVDTKMEPGSLINVDEKSSIRSLTSFVDREDEAVVKVWLRVEEKIPLEGGRSYWQIDGPHVMVG